MSMVGRELFKTHQKSTQIERMETMTAKSTHMITLQRFLKVSHANKKDFR